MKSLSFRALGIVFFQIFILSGVQNINGQEEKPEKKNLKNSVRINLTNPMIFGDQCFMIGYERTIGDHQSFTVNIGKFSLPKLLDLNTDSIADLNKSAKSRGFHLSGDYRFYLSKENKYNSPHGVYIGPYFTYNSYGRDFTFSYGNNPESLSADFTFNIASVGFQMGYQFIFWNRVSLDMLLFGPGIAAYKLKTNLDTTLDEEQETELFQKINDVLEEKIPGYDLVLHPGSFERTGSYKTTSLGFRYVIMLGIRF
jgi:hypothetical protein